MNKTKQQMVMLSKIKQITKSKRIKQLVNEIHKELLTNCGAPVNQGMKKPKNKKEK